MENLAVNVGESLAPYLLIGLALAGMAFKWTNGLYYLYIRFAGAISILALLAGWDVLNIEQKAAAGFVTLAMLVCVMLRDNKKKALETATSESK